MTRKQFVDYPANVFQHSLLKGLDDLVPDLKVISSPVIKSSYSIVKDICKGCYFSHRDVASKQEDVYVGTLALPGIQMIVELKRVLWAIKKRLDKKKENNHLIIYALHSPFLLAAVLLKKRISCSCVVVPDLPEYMSGGTSLIRFLKKIDRLVIDFCLKRLDCFVLLSPYMRERLPIRDKPWVLMEGIYDTSLIPKNVKKRKERIILYSGNLSLKYGILELLNAFVGINNKNYRLWICGNGDGQDTVLKFAKKDERIHYFGIVDHEKVLVMQQQSTVLINPRSSSGEYTKYSFPSKTMEYLASGTPTIMCHLPAIPQEYDDYIFYILDESVEGIKNKIVEVCEKSQQELDEFGRKAAEFIQTQKNAVAQAQKVINLCGGKSFV